jgi:hypothetical protein
MQVFRNVLLCAPHLPRRQAATAAERANLESTIALRQIQEDRAGDMIDEQGISATTASTGFSISRLLAAIQAQPRDPAPTCYNKTFTIAGSFRIARIF